MNPPWANNWYNPFNYPSQSGPFVPPSPYGPPPPGWDPRSYGPVQPFTWSNSYRSSKYPQLNPILAADTTMLKYDIKKSPRSEILASTYIHNRNELAFTTGASRMRLISKNFPWAIDIEAHGPITCKAVWDALHDALQQPIEDSEWALIINDKKKRETVEKAHKKRLETEPNSPLKRIDFLGDTTNFKGLERDQEFEKLRLLPGDKARPETWVVKLAG